MFLNEIYRELTVSQLSPSLSHNFLRKHDIASRMHHSLNKREQFLNSRIFPYDDSSPSKWKKKVLFTFWDSSHSLLQQSCHQIEYSWVLFKNPHEKVLNRKQPSHVCVCDSEITVVLHNKAQPNEENYFLLSFFYPTLLISDTRAGSEIAHSFLRIY